MMEFQPANKVNKIIIYNDNKKNSESFMWLDIFYTN